MIFLTPTELDSKGLADALVPFERDPVEWLAGWIGGAQRDRAERSNLPWVSDGKGWWLPRKETDLRKWT